MPTTLTGQAAFATEILLALLGLVLLARRIMKRGSGAPAAGTQSALPRWDTSILDIGVLLWVVLCGGFLAQAFGVELLKWAGIGDPWRLIIASGLFQGGMLAACVGFMTWNKTGRDMHRPRAGFVAAGALTFLVALAPVLAVGYSWGKFLLACGIEPEAQVMVTLLRSTGDTSLITALLFLAVIMAPITEELVFRAGIFRFLHARTGRISAIVLSALFFGVIHVNLASFPQLVVLGVFLALAYERTGNIAVPMLAHALFNLNTILLILAGIDA